MVVEPSDFVSEEQNTVAGTELCRTFTNGGKREAIGFIRSGEEIKIPNTAGTCVWFMTGLRIFTRCLLMERRLTVGPGLGMASLSRQG